MTRFFLNCTFSSLQRSSSNILISIHVYAHSIHTCTHILYIVHATRVLLDPPPVKHAAVISWPVQIFWLARVHIPCVVKYVLHVEGRKTFMTAAVNNFERSGACGASYLTIAFVVLIKQSTISRVPSYACKKPA